MSVNVNKKYLAQKLSEAHDLTVKESMEIIDFLLAETESALTEGKKVELTGFGKFEIRKREARQGVNPKTGERMMIEESVAPVFKASEGFKNRIQFQFKKDSE